MINHEPEKPNARASGLVVGFDLNAVPDLLGVENLEAEHGRGIHLMKFAMDEVSFERGGAEVHMRKGPARNPRTELRSNNETA